MRTFNIAGPNDAGRSYTLPPLRRLPALAPLLAEQAWFVLHAPRQTGKTTALKALATAITADGTYAGVYVTLEEGRAYPNDVSGGMAALRGALSRAAQDLPAELRPPEAAVADHEGLASALSAWAARCPRPLVVLLDEVDALEGPLLLAVLSQLSAHYPNRPGRFPSTVVLCGMRDVRDYRLPGATSAGSSSPFNIKVASFLLRNFDRDEVGELYAQHAAETGQVFPEAVVDRAFALTQGQPWLVNALARELVTVLAPAPGLITAEALEQAKENLILRRDTHLDSLVARLHEPRVQRIIEPILAGGVLPSDTVYDDDLSLCVDLGLVAGSPPDIANPIYREIIPRVLSAGIQRNPHLPTSRFMGSDGRIDVVAMMEAFQAFWIEQGPTVAAGTRWPEVACQLVFMAFLQRVVNGGGRIDREYALGAGRIDVLVTWPHTQGPQREAFELKVWRDADKRRSPLPQALEQLDRYLERLGLDQGWVILFDQRADSGEVEGRTRLEPHTSPGGRTVRVLWA